MSGINHFDITRVCESSIELPTYEILSENPNPVFRSQYGVAMIYPYTLQDHIASTPTLKKYKLLNLENKYLHVSVLPQLGGRVYSVFDKISQREVFYKNNVVKFSPLAIRGAFFSGGIEFSFPVAHAPTTASPVNWSIQQHSDGSASIVFGGVEHMGRMKWMIKLTLYPDRCALAQDVYLENPYVLPGRYHYWTNASLEANNQTEFIYPLQRVRSYEFAGTAPWPYARLDLIRNDPGLPGMEGTPQWPVDVMHDPFNFRWQKNMVTHVSIFGRDVEWNFFGAWQHSENRGYVHYADHKDVAGMKLWSWGNAPIGIVNQSALTDDGSLYAETQCGAMETQLDFDFLSPFKSKSWREWWIPLRDIKGFNCASKDIAANLKILPLSNEEEIEVYIGLCPSRHIIKAQLQLSTPEEILYSRSVSISPETPFTDTKLTKAKKVANLPLSLIVLDDNDHPILSYTFNRSQYEKDNILSLDTASSCDENEFNKGIYYEKLDQRDSALKHYQKAIELEPDHAQAHFRLGLMHLRAADFDKASYHLRKSLGDTPEDAGYYLGLIEIYNNNPQQAINYFSQIPSSCSVYLPAELAKISLLIRAEKFSEAIQDLHHLTESKPETNILPLLLGLLHRKVGNLHEAVSFLNKVLQNDPLNHIALNELSNLNRETVYRETLLRYFSDDPQYIIDSACFYISFGFLEDALQVFETYKTRYHYPMIGYLAYWICNYLKKFDQAKQWHAWAVDCQPHYCFPSRIEEILALLFSLEHYPQDYFAYYYLGNFYYARQRYDEAIDLWQKSAPHLSNFEVIFRNLGWAAWKIKHDYEGAIQHFEKALTINPQNQDLYLHLDDLYKLTGKQKKREVLLRQINSLTEIREDLRKRRVQILVDLGYEEQAITIMETEKFVPLEMDQTFHDTYVQAYLQRAEHHLQDGLVELAIEDYIKALQYPSNIGVGEPPAPDLQQAKIYYLLGEAYERLGKFNKALQAWHCAARENHPSNTPLYHYIEKALDKISRYSELGLEYPD